MSKSRPQLPNPIRYPYTEEFWRATTQERLVVQRCGSCGVLQFPPVPVCHRCQSLDVGWQEVAGTGTVFTYTWSHHPVLPELASLGVYNIAIVELDESNERDPLRVTTWITDVTPDTLRIGLRVQVHFDPIDETMALPIFAPLSTAEF